jgi:hypothetical protein
MALLRYWRFSVTIFVHFCLLLWPLAQARSVFAADWGSPCATANKTPLSRRSVRTRSDGCPPAQSSPAGVRADEGAILALFDASESTTVEEEVAKTHGLDIVSRLTLEPLGKRVVRFRIPDARSTMELVAELSADARVGSAQPNFRYRISDHPAGGANKQRRFAAEQRPDDSNNQATLRWSTASEPFVDVGARSR